MANITNEKLLEQVDGFLKSITPKDVVCIIHDTDPDGLCSAVIMAKCVEHLRGKKPNIFIPIDRSEYGLHNGMIEKIKKTKVTKLITVDFSAEGKPDKILEIEKQADILIVDHHKVYGTLPGKRTILYKPHFFTTIDPARYCTGKLAFDAASRVMNAEHLDWIATAACIADIATEPWKEWIAKVFKKYSLKMNESFFDTEIGEVAKTIKSTETYDPKLIPDCLQTLYSSANLDEFVNSKFKKYRATIDAELQKHMAFFEKKSENIGETRIYEMSSAYGIHSALSTIIALKHPHNTVFIINTSGSKVAVSARRNDQKIAVNNLLEKAIKGFEDSNAGGHTPAAGAGFPKKYLNEFKQRIIKIGRQASTPH